jgi:hypothetical protein
MTINNSITVVLSATIQVKQYSSLLNLPIIQYALPRETISEAKMFAKSHKESRQK